MSRKCWILDSLTHAGVDDIVFVGGYRIETIAQAYPHLRFYSNTEWSENNILDFVMFAAPQMDTALIASYSDFVYPRRVAQRT